MAEDTSRPSGANKYSVYAQRSVDSTQMDWNAASKELVTGLNIIQADRVARKAAIEKSTQDAIEQLSKVPETGTQDAASLLINASAMSVKEIQEQNNLMKRGLISVQDNMLFMQHITFKMITIRITSMLSCQNYYHVFRISMTL